jgi:Co/Zn/Cd efflux system component
MRADAIHLLRAALVILLVLVIVGVWPRRRYMPNTYGYRPATIASVLLLFLVLFVLFGL